MKPQLPTFLASALLTVALAQTAPDAARLLGAAQAAHGGSALARLRTYQEIATLTTFATGQPENTLTVVSYVDFRAGRIRIEYRGGDTLIQVIQYGPQKSQSWSKQTGLKALNPELAKDLHDGLYQNWYGLRLGGSGRERAGLEGVQAFADAKGQTVSVSTKGAKTTYLFNAKNQLRAERFESSQGRSTVVYGDLRKVGGVLIPFQARIYSGGTLFAEAKVREAEVNPVLEEKVWKMP